MKLRQRNFTLFDLINTLLVVLITAIVAYPLYYSLIASFSEPSEVAQGNTLLWIKNFTTDAYYYLFQEESIWIGYRNTIIYTFFGTIYNLVLTIPAAYVLSKKYLPLRNVLSWYFFLTMYLSGGLIPIYLLKRSLGLLNNPLVMIIDTGVSCYNLIVTRQYFSSSIPNEIYEAAQTDGASEFRCFWQIALPLAKPIIAVMALFYGVEHWNSYYKALIYLQESNYFPLQLIMRNILFVEQQMDAALSAGLDAEGAAYYIRKAEMVVGMKYGLYIVASIPLLIAYPFVQKHFTKGIMIGSVKG